MNSSGGGPGNEVNELNEQMELNESKELKELVELNEVNEQIDLSELNDLDALSGLSGPRELKGLSELNGLNASNEWNERNGLNDQIERGTGRKAPTRIFAYAQVLGPNWSMLRTKFSPGLVYFSDLVGSFKARTETSANRHVLTSIFVLNGPPINYFLDKKSADRTTDKIGDFEKIFGNMYLFSD